MTQRVVSQCAYCRAPIENDAQFKEHFKRHNNIGAAPNQPKPNGFACIVCRQILTSNSEYTAHVKHHLRRQQVVQPSALNQQQQAAATPNAAINSVRCGKCSLKFEHWSELSEHMASAHPSNGASSSSVSTSSSLSSPLQTSRSANANNNNNNNNNNAGHGQQQQQSAHMHAPRSALGGMLQQSHNNNNNTNVKEERHSPGLAAASSSVSFHYCEICSNKFDSSLKLQAHLLLKHEFKHGAGAGSLSSSSSSSSLACPVCDEVFAPARVDLLLAHTLVHGQAAKVYKCTQCTQAFVFKSQLINHSFSHHQTARQQPHQQQLSTHSNYNHTSLPANHHHPQQQQQHNG